MSQQRSYSGGPFNARRIAAAAKRRFSFLLLLLVVVTVPLMSFVQQGTAAPRKGQEEGICIAWNISGEWQYQASQGGYGTLTFQQKAGGILDGSYYNAATGGSGTFSGGIDGQAVRFTSDAAEYFEGTLDSTGKNITGIFPDRSTLEAKGHATCLERLEPPAEGAAQITIRWGPYVYRREIAPAARMDLNGANSIPRLQPGVPVIRNALRVRVWVQVLLYGNNLPNSLAVRDLVNNTIRELGTIGKVGQDPSGFSIYQGTITIDALGPIAPGVREVHNVFLVNLRNNQWIGVGQVILNLIDPSGTIYDANTKEALEGATVSCYVRQGGQWLLWGAEKFGQGNPLVSDQEGNYGWDVPPGRYKVKATRHCYGDVESAVVEVPPPRTDVHLGMPPLGCAEVTIDDLWTSDDSSFAATSFQAGQAIEYHVIVENSGSEDSQLAITWNTVGPNGIQVMALSGSGDYTVQPGSGLDIKIDGQLPGTAAAGRYTLSAELTHKQQTSLKITQFEVASPPNVHLPVIMRIVASSTPQPPQRGIYGKVTQSNSAVANVPLALRLFDGSEGSDIANTTTDADGAYRFDGINPLKQEEVYYVRFGPNYDDSSRLLVWFGPDIDAYTGTTEVSGGNFDIADVQLLAPDPGATVSLPFTFSWQRRGIAGDGYRVILVDLDSGDSWTTDDLGDTGSITIDELPPKVMMGKPYAWYVEVYNGPDSYGVSFYYQEITFRSSNQARDAIGVPEMPYGIAGGEPAYRVMETMGALLRTSDKEECHMTRSAILCRTRPGR